jgi:transposase
VIAYVEAGHSCRAAARHFLVIDSFAIKLLQRVRQTGSVSARPQGRPRGGKLDAHASFLIAAVEAQPDLTMPELSARLAAERAVTVAPAMLSRFLCRHGFSYKKKP